MDLQLEPGRGGELACVLVGRGVSRPAGVGPGGGVRVPGPSGSGPRGVWPAGAPTIFFVRKTGNVSEVARLMNFLKCFLCWLINGG